MPRIRCLPSRVPLVAPRVATLQPGSWHAGNASSTQRGYGYKWQVERKAYLEAHPFCVMCLKELGIKAKDNAGIIVECATRGLSAPRARIVDHKIPHRGDQHLFWQRSNWQPLCKPHHDGAKQREEANQL
jgi:5-methylcytosine-specific restriction endonuclease McrA